MARTAFVFKDELETGRAQIFYGKEPYSNPNFQVIEVDQSHKGQQATENRLITKVKSEYPQATIIYNDNTSFIIN